MVAASTLRRITSDLDAIGARLKPKFGVLFVRLPQRMAPFKDRVIERHKELFAEDREAELLVFATIYEDKPGAPLRPLNPNEPRKAWNGKEIRDKSDEAWRAVARELIKSGELN